MKPVIRFVLAPLGVGFAAWGLAQGYIRYEERSARREIVTPKAATKENILALRIAAIDSAKSLYQLALATEKETFEREKKEADFPELAELSHEVRMLRIDLEHQTALAAIDKKYPPANPAPPTPPVPQE